MIYRNILLSTVLCALFPLFAAAGRTESDTVLAILAGRSADVCAAATVTDSRGFLCFARAAGYVFPDSTASFTATYMHWRGTTDGKGGLLLRDAEGRYLSVGSASGSMYTAAWSKEVPEHSFSSRGGCLSTLYGGRRYYLVLFSSPGGHSGSPAFGFSLSAPGSKSGSKPTYTTPLVSDTSAVRTSSGVIRLYGHCNAGVISAVAAQARGYLDLRPAILPSLLPEDYTCAEHLLKIVNSADAARLSSLAGVAAADTAAVNLVSPLTLSDTVGFCSPLPLLTGENALSYSRTFSPHGWSSLCLPFTPASIPAGLEVFAPSLPGSDGVIRTQRVTGMKAFIPYLVRVSSAGALGEVFTFTSAPEDTAEAASGSADAEGYFGTAMHLGADSLSGSLYLLSSDGFTFRRTAEGSWLAPFRCGLLLRSLLPSKSLRIEAGEVTKAETLRQTRKTGPVYTPDGIRLPGARYGGHGIYISDGKKKYLKK